MASLENELAITSISARAVSGESGESVESCDRAASTNDDGTSAMVIGKIIGKGLDLNTYTVFITSLHPTEEKKPKTNASLAIVKEFFNEPRVKNQIKSIGNLSLEQNNNLGRYLNFDLKTLHIALRSS